MFDSRAPYGIGCVFRGKSRPIRVWEREREFHQALAKARKWIPASPSLEVVVVDNRGRCVARFAQEH